MKETAHPHPSKEHTMPTLVADIAKAVNRMNGDQLRELVAALDFSTAGAVEFLLDIQVSA